MALKTELRVTVPHPSRDPTVGLVQELANRRVPVLRPERRRQALRACTKRGPWCARWLSGETDRPARALSIDMEKLIRGVNADGDGCLDLQEFIDLNTQAMDDDERGGCENSNDDALLVAPEVRRGPRSTVSPRAIEEL